MTKLRKSARGRDCQVRLPGVCNFNSETTVLAHLNGAGMGMKKHDLHAAFTCSNCHSAIDMQLATQYTTDELKLAHYEGVERTQDIWLKEGLINVR